MRILFHWPSARQDGAASEAGCLIAALRAQGHQLRVVGGGLGVVAGLSGLLPPALRPWGEIWADRVAASRLQGAWRGFAPELMFTQATPYHGAAGRLARATRSALIVWAPRRPGADWRAQTGRLRSHGKAAEAALWRAADRVFVPDAELAELLHEDGLPRQKLTVQPAGMAGAQGSGWDAVAARVMEVAAEDLRYRQRFSASRLG